MSEEGRVMSEGLGVVSEEWDDDRVGGREMSEQQAFL